MLTYVFASSARGLDTKKYYHLILSKTLHMLMRYIDKLKFIDLSYLVCKSCQYQNKLKLTKATI